jgi:DNA-binding PadR family transcriptional regulator
MSPRQSANLSLEHVLLALISQKEMHGYELYQAVCAVQGVSQVWNIKQSMLYALLDKLERGGLLVSRQESGEAYPPRKTFRLTEAGGASLREWIVTPVRRARDLRQEFLAKLIIARRFGAGQALVLIANQEQACRAWLADLREHVPPGDADHIDARLVHSFRVNRVEGVLGWLQECRAEITPE